MGLAVFDVASSELLDQDDLDEAGSALQACNAAAILVYEKRWAAGLLGFLHLVPGRGRRVERLELGVVGLELGQVGAQLSRGLRVRFPRCAGGADQPVRAARASTPEGYCP
jgi:hypothetical protein